MRISVSDLASRQRAPRPRPEREIQRAILDFLRTLPGVVAWKTGGGLLPLADGRRVRMGHKGVSDIVGFRVEYWPVFRPDRPEAPRRPADEKIARFLAVEVKRPGKRCTDEQMAFLDFVTRAGGIAVMASSVDEVAAALGLKPISRAGRRAMVWGKAFGERALIP